MPYIIKFQRPTGVWYFIQTQNTDGKIRVTKDKSKASLFKTAMAASLIASQNKGQIIKTETLTTQAVWVDEKKPEKEAEKNGNADNSTSQP